MIAQRLGRKVVLVERGKHPRVVIGESSTPLSNLLFDELTEKYFLPNLRPLSKWGSWRDTYPDIACGLKRGFSFFHHAGEAAAGADLDRARQLLVAASPHDQIADTHWYRADFDQFLTIEAQKGGTDYFDDVTLTEVLNTGNRISMAGTRHGEKLAFSAQFVVDASGPRGFLHRAFRLEESRFPSFPETQALYSHFSGVQRIEDLLSGDLIGPPPYPIDDAAVHHILDGGWVWVLHFSNGITSAGVAASAGLAARLELGEGAPAWQRLIRQVPILDEQFARAEAVQPFRHIARLAFRSAKVSGRNWALMPSAAGFVDPLLSTGFPLTLLGIERLAGIIERDWGTDSFDAQLEKYSEKTEAELLATSRLVSALYANMNNFPVFSAVSLVYFAAASYSETVRRLGKPELAPSFLLYDHPRFGPGCARLLERALVVRRGRESEEFIDDVFRFIEPFDVAGLCDRGRRNWYPALAEDLLNSAAKVDSSRDEVMQMLERCRFWPATSLQERS